MLILAEIFAFGEGLLLIRYFDRLKSLLIGSSTDQQFWMDWATLISNSGLLCRIALRAASAASGDT